MIGNGNKNHNCSFCGRSSFMVKKLIEGLEAFICDECVMLSKDALMKEKESTFLTNELFDLSPKKMKEEFDKHVIGQDEAKKSLAVGVVNHYLRLMLQQDSALKDGKVNLLMIGPTSSGKTLLMRVLQKMLRKYGIPVAFADATTFTEAGYVGDDAEVSIQRLLQEADYNVQRAQRGIVFYDEVDKIAMKSGSSSVSRDVSGEGVQQALLGILQGRTVNVSPPGAKKGMGQEQFSVDTTDILFICAGAFSGLDKMIEERQTESKVGFHGIVGKSKDFNQYAKVETEDLIKFGFIPEFIGRLPSVVTLQELTKEQLMEVLEKPENSLINQYKALFKAKNAELIIKPDAIEAIAEETMKKQVSARGLRSVLESIFKDTMFYLEDYIPCEVIVDAEAVRNCKPEVRKIADNTAKLFTQG